MQKTVRRYLVRKSKHLKQICENTTILKQFKHYRKIKDRYQTTSDPSSIDKTLKYEQANAECRTQDNTTTTTNTKLPLQIVLLHWAEFLAEK